MSQAVVDGLETVDIEIRQRHGRARHARTLHALRQLFVEAAPVGNTRQGVGGGGKLQRRMYRLGLGDFVDQAIHAFHRAALAHIGHIAGLEGTPACLPLAVDGEFIFDLLAREGALQVGFAQPISFFAQHLADRLHHAFLVRPAEPFFKRGVDELVAVLAVDVDDHHGDMVRQQLQAPFAVARLRLGDFALGHQRVKIAAQVADFVAPLDLQRLDAQALAANLVHLAAQALQRLQQAQHHAPAGQSRQRRQQHGGQQDLAADGVQRRERVTHGIDGRQYPARGGDAVIGEQGIDALRGGARQPALEALHGAPRRFADGAMRVDMLHDARLVGMLDDDAFAGHDVQIAARARLERAQAPQEIGLAQVHAGRQHIAHGALRVEHGLRHHHDGHAGNAAVERRGNHRTPGRQRLVEIRAAFQVHPRLRLDGSHAGQQGAIGGRHAGRVELLAQHRLRVQKALQAGAIVRAAGRQAVGDGAQHIALRVEFFIDEDSGAGQRYILLASRHIAHAALGHAQGGQRQRGHGRQHEQEDDHAHARLQAGGQAPAQSFSPVRHVRC